MKKIELWAKGKSRENRGERERERGREGKREEEFRRCSFID